MCRTVNSTSKGSVCTSRHRSPRANRADGELIPRVAAQMHAVASRDGGIWMNAVSAMIGKNERKFVSKLIEVDGFFARQ